nr:uncharacterized protein CTRU02_00729 [Colletotrichum truncatum]KAF6801980.1 hypothetical protein CTRU02_00729 [Colletotrichum truncatum]
MPHPLASLPYTIPRPVLPRTAHYVVVESSRHSARVDSWTWNAGGLSGFAFFSSTCELTPIAFTCRQYVSARRGFSGLACPQTDPVTLIRQALSRSMSTDPASLEFSISSFAYYYQSVDSPVSSDTHHEPINSSIPKASRGLPIVPLVRRHSSPRPANSQEHKHEGGPMTKPAQPLGPLYPISHSVLPVHRLSHRDRLNRFFFF